MATPIGNLRDISLRALDVLGSVDAVAAEDTRVTARLLAHYGVSRRLIAVHEHNERRAAREVLALLAAGRSVALVCDAGTPAVSDPGALLVAQARAAGHAVVPVPGANAALAALSVSGLPAPHFLFYGFLPARGAARRRELERLAALPCPIVFYEAPHRILECAADLAAVLGAARRVAIARELTKRFETVHLCALGEACEWLRADAHRVRGEFVLIVEGAAEAPARGAEAGRVLEALLAALPLKQAVALAARITGARRNELYRLALSLKKRES
ncbi:MAG TPA: 16S rRNA (cytidine(1402)-2'-O)-methyltransferase [Burkholderiales bacterium]|nr:16S rRNA (cytidine(1402)-2'-O)-methyltransferase [Burkholderiales bacterium]